MIDFCKKQYVVLSKEILVKILLYILCTFLELSLYMNKIFTELGTL